MKKKKSLQPPQQVDISEISLLPEQHSFLNLGYWWAAFNDLYPVLACLPAGPAQAGCGEQCVLHLPQRPTPSGRAYLGCPCTAGSLDAHQRMLALLPALSLGSCLDACFVWIGFGGDGFSPSNTSYKNTFHHFKSYMKQYQTKYLLLIFLN